MILEGEQEAASAACFCWRCLDLLVVNQGEVHIYIYIALTEQQLKYDTIFWQYKQNVYMFVFYMYRYIYIYIYVCVSRK